MTASPAHVTLVANTVSTVTVDDFNRVEVLNVDGSAAVYFTVDGTTPTIEGNGCNVLPAAIGGLVLPVSNRNEIIVKMISAGTPKMSVRGVG